LGVGTALKQKGHLNYEPSTVAAELLLQRDIQGNTTKQTAFREFATNYTQLRVYLAMVGKQKTVTMIHMIRAFIQSGQQQMRTKERSLGSSETAGQPRNLRQCASLKSKHGNGVWHK
jgi:hypothetical protein